MLLFSLLQDLLIVSPVRIPLGADAQYPGSFSQSQCPAQVVKLLLMENTRQGSHAHCAGFPGNDHRIAPPGLPQQPHAKGRVVIRAGQKGVGTGPQDVPGQGAGLPAAQPRHHAVHIPGHRVELPIRCLGGAVQTVSLVGLHDAGDGTVLPPPVSDTAQYRSGKATHAGLQKQVGGGLVPRLGQLIKDLPGQGGIPLHNPGGDLLIPRPGGVLDQHPAVFFALSGGQTHRVVVVEVGDHNNNK